MVERIAKTSHVILRELSHFMRKPERRGKLPPLALIAASFEVVYGFYSVGNVDGIGDLRGDGFHIFVSHWAFIECVFVDGGCEYSVHFFFEVG